MRIDGQTLRRNEMVIPHVDLKAVKGWAKATFTKERIVEGALCAATVGVTGMVLFSLHRAMENYIISGF